MKQIKHGRERELFKRTRYPVINCEIMLANYLREKAKNLNVISFMREVICIYIYIDYLIAQILNRIYKSVVLIKFLIFTWHGIQVISCITRLRLYNTF